MFLYSTSGTWVTAEPRGLPYGPLLQDLFSLGHKAGHSDVHFSIWMNAAPAPAHCYCHGYTENDNI